MLTPEISPMKADSPLEAPNFVSEAPNTSFGPMTSDEGFEALEMAVRAVLWGNETDAGEIRDDEPP